MRNAFRLLVAAVADALPGAAFVLWLTFTVFLWSLLLGGGYGAEMRALAASGVGTWAGLLVARRLPPSRVVHFTVWGLGSLLLLDSSYWTDAARLVPLGAWIIPALFMLPAGFVLRVAPHRTTSPFPLILGLVFGVPLSWAVLSSVGPSFLVPAAMAAAFPSLVASPSRSSPLSIRISSADEGAEPSRSSPRFTVLSILLASLCLGALVPPLFLVFRSGYSLAADGGLLSIFVLCVLLFIATLVVRLVPPSPDAMQARARAFAVGGSALAVLVFAFPFLSTRLPAPGGEDSHALFSAVLWFECAAFILVPYLVMVLRFASTRQRDLSLLIASVAAASAAVADSLSLDPFVLVRDVAIITICLSSLLVGFRLLDRNKRAFRPISWIGASIGVAFVVTLAPRWSPPKPHLSESEASNGDGRRSPKKMLPSMIRFVESDEDGWLSASGTPEMPLIARNRDVLVSTPDVVALRLAAHLSALSSKKGGHFYVVGDMTGISPDVIRRYEPMSLVVGLPKRAERRMVAALPLLNGNVVLDPRLKIWDGSPRLIRPGEGRFDGILVAVPSVDGSKQRSLLSYEALHFWRRQLSKGGTLTLLLPRFPAETYLRDLIATFVEVFPHSRLWSTGGASPRLILSGRLGAEPFALARIQTALLDTKAREALADIDVTSALDIVRYLVLTGEGTAAVDGQVLRDRGRWPTLLQDRNGMAVLVDALRPLLPAFSLTGSSEDGARLQVVLDQVLERHRAYFSMLRGLNKGIFTSVLSEARAVLRLDPKGGHQLSGFVRPYLRRAEQFRQAGELDKAVEQLSMARLINPRSTETAMALARIFAQQGKSGQAIELYREVLKNSPDHAGAAVALAGLYQEGGRREEAIALLTNLVTREPDNAVLYSNLGTLYLSGGDVDKARPLFERAIRLRGTLPQPHAGLAQCFMAKGNYDGARQEIEIAVRLEPSADFLNLLGQIAYRQGDRVGARRAFVRCLLKNPDHVEARGGLGILHAEAGQIDKAREAWERVLAVDPDNIPAKENLEALKKLYLGDDR